MLARRERDPLRQHGERAAGLLELLKRSPLALKNREGCRVERVASLKPAAEKIARFGFGRGGVDGHPLCRKLMPPLEAPIGIIPRYPFPDALVADILEQAPPDNLADLGL